MALPNGPMEIVFSFDTTGSMYSYLEEVRGRVSDMIQRLQADIPGIKIAIFAHGDYCDRKTYVTKYIDFTDDVAKLVAFVNNVKRTSGGDADECYELVLHEVRTKLTWTPGSQRALVMIGDCRPHEPDYSQNKLKLDWRKEADSLAVVGVRIYSVQCGSNSYADEFYGDIAKKTCGQHLKLEDFKNIFDFLMTVCYRENGDDLFQNYEKEVRARTGAIHKDLDKLFGDLRDKAPTVPTTVSPSAAAATKPAPKTTHKLIKLTKATPLTNKPSFTKRSIRTKPAVPKHKKFEEKYLAKLRRENVTECNFTLREMPWSAWKIAVSPSEMKSFGVTTLRSGSGCGFRAKSIFGGKTNVPALYEIAVQTKYRTRKHVVYNKLCRRGFANKANWERCLLGRSDIRTQVNDVVKKNCSVFIRRMVIKTPKINTAARKSLKRYDYAWKALRSERVGHRKVTKDSIDISNEMDV
ncbi:uncharacterized protein LOC123553388 [Mercenaria mercenaria]|uniref:uncharacterized protein LOC123553388 n=1 Tax=Mercenaria mercenaria TaxID=6596 RepID=UPI00234EC272|nr:uncharacterized protein LOC123553388 [Mercenaria mercenaria]